MGRTQLMAALIVMVVAVALVAARSTLGDGNPAGTGIGAGMAELPDLGPAPALIGLDGWLQTDDPVAGPDLDGRVVIVHFWTFGCVNCRNTLPNLRDLYDRHHDDGLEILGVHAPEFAHERDPEAIAEAAVDLGVTWPIALDTEKTNFRDWQPGSTNFWPRTYVLDPDRRIRFDHIGEGAYDDLNDTVATLLAGR